MMRRYRHARSALLAMAVAAAVEAQDLEYGPPYVLEGSFAVAGAVAAAADGFVFVAETGANRVRSVRLPAGDLARAPEWQAFGEVARDDPAALDTPQGIAVDSRGNVYVADTADDEVVIFRPDGSGGYLFAGRLAAAGVAASPPSLLRPRDVAVGADDRIYVLDSGHRRVLVASGPDAARWGLHRAGSGWSEAYGLGIAADGTVYVADTGNHRVLRLPVAGAEEAIGRFGASGAGLRYPRDVEVGPHDGRLYVADAHNHRIAVFDADGGWHRSLGHAPLLGRPDKLAFGRDGRLLVADGINGWVVMWSREPRPGTTRVAEFDGYLRDDLGDTGAEPQESSRTSSPDVLIRRRPDLDLDVAERVGLSAVGDDPPLYDHPSFVYFQVHNRGPDPWTGGAVEIWTRPIEGDDEFPARWSRAPFFRLWGDDATRQAGHILELPYVPAREEDDGRVIAGPLVWYPPAPSSGGACGDEALLMARLVQLNDPVEAFTVDALEQAQASNDVVVRRLPVVPASCVPSEDRYEQNDRWETRKRPNETWEHLHARCPRMRGRADEYPEARCPGIFENAPGFGGPSAAFPPRGAEEIWNLLIADLSLHGTSDRDYFEIRLPDLGDPRWEVHDINPLEVRWRGEESPFSYEPQTMPECGMVQRRDIGLGTLDRTVYVSISTELLVSVEPAPGATAERALEPEGDVLHLYRDGVREEGHATGSSLVKRIVCPQSREALRAVELSFGERTNEEGLFEPRELGSLGGYQLRLQYLASITRGIPDWVSEFNEGRGIRLIPCLGGDPGGVFPFCRRGQVPGLGPIGVDLIHPQTPGLLDCIADGPGCFELSGFEWQAAGRLDLTLFAAGLKVRLLNAKGKEIATARPVAGANRAALRLVVERLPAGSYYLAIQGKPTPYSLQWKPPATHRARTAPKSEG